MHTPVQNPTRKINMQKIFIYIGTKILQNTINDEIKHLKIEPCIPMSFPRELPLLKNQFLITKLSEHKALVL